MGGCLGCLGMDTDDTGVDDWPVTAVATDAATARAEMQVTWFSTG